MKFRKNVICFGMAILLLMVPSMRADAATHKAGCGATAQRIECTSIRVLGGSEGSHLLYTTANGTMVWCDKYSEQFRHNIYCANSACSVLLAGNVARKCKVYHSVCPDETGLCQY